MHIPTLFLFASTLAFTIVAAVPASVGNHDVSSVDESIVGHPRDLDYVDELGRDALSEEMPILHRRLAKPIGKVLKQAAPAAKVAAKRPPQPKPKVQPPAQKSSKAQASKPDRQPATRKANPVANKRPVVVGKAVKTQVRPTPATKKAANVSKQRAPASKKVSQAKISKPKNTLAQKKPTAKLSKPRAGPTKSLKTNLKRPSTSKKVAQPKGLTAKKPVAPKKSTARISKSRTPVSKASNSRISKVSKQVAPKKSTARISKQRTPASKASNSRISKKKSTPNSTKQRVLSNAKKPLTKSPKSKVSTLKNQATSKKDKATAISQRKAAATSAKTKAAGPALVAKKAQAPQHLSKSAGSRSGASCSLRRVHARDLFRRCNEGEPTAPAPDVEIKVPGPNGKPISEWVHSSTNLGATSAGNAGVYPIKKFGEKQGDFIAKKYLTGDQKGMVGESGVLKKLDDYDAKNGGQTGNPNHIASGSIGDDHWLVMNRVDGKPLTKTKEYADAMSPENNGATKLAFLQQKHQDVASANVELHQKTNQVHMDIKDDNVLWHDKSKGDGLKPTFIDYGRTSKNDKDLKNRFFDKKFANRKNLKYNKDDPAENVKAYTLQKAEETWPTAGLTEE